MLKFEYWASFYNFDTPQGQYVYLHHAVLHSLTFDCRSVPGDMFLQNYNKLIEKNGGERIIDKQFQVRINCRCHGLGVSLVFILFLILVETEIFCHYF